MQLCFAGLKREDKDIALNALKRVSQLLDEVLHDGTITLDALEGTLESDLEKMAICYKQIVSTKAAKW